MSPLRPRPIGGSTLVRDYLEGTGSAATFYGRPPHDLDGYRDKLREVQGRVGPAERRLVAQAVTPTTARAGERLDRFVEEGGAVVTTGQQTGLFTGPLYTVYKILSAVALAEHLEGELGIIVLPVFWSASEDHDWEEVNEAHLLDPRGRLHRIAVPDGDPRPLPMSDRRLEGSLDSFCDDIVHLVSGEGDARRLLKEIIDPYRGEEQTVAGAFREAILTLFRDVDLLVTEASDPVLKRASAGVLGSALVDAAEHEARLEARTTALRDAGYSTQVAVLDGGINVFLRTDAGRERLYRRGSGFGVRGRSERWDREEVLRMLDQAPGRFSPNVFLRPVVESAVFPTLAYVGGPGEIAYFAQAAALFEAYDIGMPVLVPRFSGVVIEPRIERALEKLALTEDDLARPRHVLQDRIARREVPPALEESILDARTRLAAGFERMIVEASAIDPTLADAIGGLRNRGLADLGRAERKVIRAIKRQDGEALARLDRVLDAVQPHGQPQDRVLNVLTFIARYGERFIPMVQEAIRAGWPLPVSG